ncbi:MAG: hypothetical protein ACLUUO_02840 [Sellimonas intestinalis]
MIRSPLRSLEERIAMNPVDESSSPAPEADGEAREDDPAKGGPA